MRDITYLGALSSEQQTDLNVRAGQLEDLHIQAIEDLSILADQGRDVTGFKAELDALGQQISLLKADVVTLGTDAAALGSWNARADELDQHLRDVLSRTGSERQSAPELAQLQGLGWGLLVFGAAITVGGFVYANRRKRRR